MKRLFTCVFLSIMLVTMAFCGCSPKDEVSSESSTVNDTVVAGEPNTDDTTSVYETGDIVGEGDIHIYVSVTDSIEQTLIAAFDVYTDAENVGDALLEYNIIAGEESEYGLYVKTVNGVTADYDVDGTYWAFYVNGDMSSNGVSGTPVEDGASYMFQIEEG